MIHIFVVCDKGLEDICQAELERFGAKTQVYPTVIVATVKDAEAIARILLFAQSITKLCLHIDSTKLPINDEEYLEKISHDKLFKEMIKDTFCVESKGAGDQNRAFILGGKLKNITNVGVDLKKPFVEILAYEHDGFLHIGIDLTQTTISKREYRIFQTASAIKATIAYGLLQIGEYTSKTTLLDPAFGMGTIPIEAALFASGKSHLEYTHQLLPLWKYDLFKDIKVEKLLKDEITKKTTSIIGFDPLGKHVDFAKKNAKIAGVLEHIRLTKVDTDWIDMKVQEKINLVVTLPPLFSKDQYEKATKWYKQFFHRSKEAFEKNTKVVFVTNDVSAIKQLIPEFFVIEHERSIAQGQSIFDVIVLKKTE